MRIFLDANILFSAAKADGAMRSLVEWLHKDGHQLWADGYVLDEARRNLHAKAPASLAAFEKLTGWLEIEKAHPADMPASLPERLPEKDRPVLAAAIRLRCDALVTGDRKHFGSLYGKKIQGVTVHSARTLAEALL